MTACSSQPNNYELEKLINESIEKQMPKFIQETKQKAINEYLSTTTTLAPTTTTTTTSTTTTTPVSYTHLTLPTTIEV